MFANDDKNSEIDKFIFECLSGKKSSKRQEKEKAIRRLITTKSRSLSNSKRSKSRSRSPNTSKKSRVSGHNSSPRYGTTNREISRNSCIRYKDDRSTSPRRRQNFDHSSRRGSLSGRCSDSNRTRSTDVRVTNLVQRRRRPDNSNLSHRIRRYEGNSPATQNLLERISLALNSNFRTRNIQDSSNGSSSRDKIPKILLDEFKNSEAGKTIRDCGIDVEELLNLNEHRWTRPGLAELYYLRNNNTQGCIASSKCQELCDKFEQFVNNTTEIRKSRPKFEAPVRRPKIKIAQLNSDESECENNTVEKRIEEHTNIINELETKQKHPDRLHPELWYNDQGELNDGPLCRCTAKSKQLGIRHNIYAGEGFILPCNPDTNNADRLFHYRITVSPPTNFLIKTPTVINHDDHEFIFEGFSLFSHYEIPYLPNCKVIRFNINYTIVYVAETIPDNFTIRELQLFDRYFFSEILELVDFDLYPSNGKDGCPMFHFMPRFVRELPGNGTELLPMCQVLDFLLKSYCPVLDPTEVKELQKLSTTAWQERISPLIGMLITNPGSKPCSIRVDQIDRDISSHPDDLYPDVVHFGIRPPQLSYAGNKKYQRLWSSYVKYRHLLANLPKPSTKEKSELLHKEKMLNDLKAQSKLKRGVTVVLSCKGFMKTGIMCDMVQHAMMLPILVSHLRFHRSLECLEKRINYKFKNRYLLQMALTHPSYREHFGTNPDHVRNVLTNCGIRQVEYGDRSIHYMNSRKRGISTLINIMSRFGQNSEMESKITHNERLEFLGDAIIEFITSVHLFFLFPDIEEGGLATYRAAIVQNQNLTMLAQVLNLEHYMLFAHGSDLCHDLELRHAMANCFEALIASIYLDGGIEVADRVFSDTFLEHERDLIPVWKNYQIHVLQEQEPQGDRKWISTCPILEKLTKLEESVGITFTHIRLLARAFTDRSIGYTNLTFGSNQRMEFLGDTVLQLICSTYLYKHFPDHHEGHLSLLRSSLVNNKTQSIISDDLNLATYAMYANPKQVYKIKDRADLLEAFLGALYIDKGIEYCEEFCKICFFPRLQEFIVNQDWNDPKSKLQQCCLTLRSMEGHEPDIPLYKTIECKGPTNGRVYTVAVYFKGERLATGRGHNIQQAEMNAAKKALTASQDFCPQSNQQKLKNSETENTTSANTDNSNQNVVDTDDEKYENYASDAPLTSTMFDLLNSRRLRKRINNKSDNEWESMNGSSELLKTPILNDGKTSIGQPNYFSSEDLNIDAKYQPEEKLKVNQFVYQIEADKSNPCLKEQSEIRQVDKTETDESISYLKEQSEIRQVIQTDE